MPAARRPAGNASEQRGIALLRLALVPIALLGDASTPAGVSSSVFPWVVGALAVYALLCLAASFAVLPARPLAAAQATLDLAFVALLVASTGGPESPLKFTFYVLPIGAALRLSPRLTAT